MQEFDLIHRHFAPLAGEAGLGLLDDAACFTPPMGQDIVISKDVLIAGVHFFADDDPASIAKKALGVNLSDLAAKGAKPTGYLLGLAISSDVDDVWLTGFSNGLKQTQDLVDMSLFGGDTVKTDGPITISITIFGTVMGGKMVTRSGAKEGDILCVTGDIGAAALGLKMRQGKIDTVVDYALDRYLHPRPRNSFGIAMSAHVTAAIDISDGLIADAGHLAKASNVNIQLNLGDIPMHASLLKTMVSDESLIKIALTGGDDYELLITARPDKVAYIQSMADQRSFPLTVIGSVQSGMGVALLDDDGNSIEVESTGYKHFDD